VFSFKVIPDLDDCLRIYTCYELRIAHESGTTNGLTDVVKFYRVRQSFGEGLGSIDVPHVKTRFISDREERTSVEWCEIELTDTKLMDGVELSHTLFGLHFQEANLSIVTSHDDCKDWIGNLNHILDSIFEQILELCLRVPRR
jgi:hypothetical protein